MRHGVYDANVHHATRAHRIHVQQDLSHRQTAEEVQSVQRDLRGIPEPYLKITSALQAESVSAYQACLVLRTATGAELPDSAYAAKDSGVGHEPGRTVSGKLRAKQLAEFRAFRCAAARKATQTTGLDIVKIRPARADDPVFAVAETGNLAESGADGAERFGVSLAHAQKRQVLRREKSSGIREGHIPGVGAIARAELAEQTVNTFTICRVRHRSPWPCSTLDFACGRRSFKTTHFPSCSSAACRR